MKYVRLGDLNVDVSINGFAIKLENYVASIPHFVRQGKVMTWKRLVRKFEKHLVWNITKSTASYMAASKGRVGATALMGGETENPTTGSPSKDDVMAKSKLLFGTAEKLGKKTGTGKTL